MAKHKKLKKSKTPRPKKKKLNREQISILGETNYIISRAQHYDSRVVSLGSLIFFSTETGDSWMLDYNQGLALCLAKDGEKQPFRIVETSDKFTIEWNATYQIEGDKFFVISNSGQAKTIIGYPTEEILNAIQRITI
jgi:hypothetical protein